MQEEAPHSSHGLSQYMIGSAGAGGKHTWAHDPGRRAATGAMTGTTAEQLLSALYQRMQVQPFQAAGSRPMQSIRN